MPPVPSRLAIVIVLFGVLVMQLAGAGNWDRLGVSGRFLNWPFQSGHAACLPSFRYDSLHAT